MKFIFSLSFLVNYLEEDRAHPLPFNSSIVTDKKDWRPLLLQKLILHPTQLNRDN